MAEGKQCGTGGVEQNGVMVEPIPKAQATKDDVTTARSQMKQLSILGAEGRCETEDAAHTGVMATGSEGKKVKVEQDQSGRGDGSQRENEDAMGGPRFSPQLFIQRYVRVMEILKAYEVKKVSVCVCVGWGGQQTQIHTSRADCSYGSSAHFVIRPAAVGNV